MTTPAPPSSADMLHEIKRIRSRLRHLLETTKTNDLKVSDLEHQQREIKAVLTVLLDDLDRLDPAPAPPREGG